MPAAAHLQAQQPGFMSPGSGDGVVGSEIEANSTSAATTGNLFRYDSTGDQYIFNLGTKSLSTGTWQIRIELDDGTSKYVTIGLK